MPLPFHEQAQGPAVPPLHDVAMAAVQAAGGVYSLQRPQGMPGVRVAAQATLSRQAGGCSTPALAVCQALYFLRGRPTL